MLRLAIHVVIATLVEFHSVAASADDLSGIGPETVAQTRVRALQGSAVDQNNLGCFYQKGFGVAENDTEAVSWFLKAAQSGLAPAQYNLACCLMDGEGTPKNIPLAIEWLRKAASVGHVRSQNELGLAYGRGTGVPQDHAQAVYWFRMAAGIGYSWAQYNLSVCYRTGEGVSKDQSQAVNWIRKAATAGLPIAQKDLAYVYANGNGVPENREAAVYWWRKAAENGDVTSQHNLAYALSQGNGCRQDQQEALAWYREAASKGLRDSQNNLGYAYQIGNGVPKNIVEAYAWTILSADQGYENAILEMPNLENLVTSAERVQALTRSREIKAKIAAGEPIPVPGVANNPAATPPLRKIQQPEGSSDHTTIFFSGGGTGFFITEQGHVLTCAHVVASAKKLWIKGDSKTLQAMRIVKMDEKEDVALLAPMNPGTFKAVPIPLASKSPRVGESVFTIGFPNSEFQGLTAKFTDGRISSTTGILDNPGQFQISVAIQPGNSGGPLLNMQGEVVGVIQSVLSSIALLKLGKEVPQNVSYAGKIQQAQGVLDGLMLPPPSNFPSIPTQGADALPDMVEAVMPSVVQVLSQ